MGEGLCARLVSGLRLLPCSKKMYRYWHTDRYKAKHEPCSDTILQAVYQMMLGSGSSTIPARRLYPAPTT